MMTAHAPCAPGGCPQPVGGLRLAGLLGRSGVCRRVLFGLAMVAVTAACTSPLNGVDVRLRRPVDSAVVCLKDGRAIPIAACAAQKGSRTALVVNTEVGSVARLNLDSGDFYDDDAFIPGVTPILLGARPATIVAAADGAHAFVTVPGGQAIVRLDVVTLARVSQALPGKPSDVIEVGDELLVALPDQQVVVRIPEAEFGNLTTLANIPMPQGQPYDLASAGDGSLWVGHLDRAWVSRVDLASGAVTARVPVAAPCMDGLDNDGNGKVDAADWGCRAGLKVEQDAPAGAAPFEVVDLGAAIVPPQCMNGLDDDGDGATDFPDDVGCVGPTAALESGASTPVLAKLALTAEGDLLYALNRRDRTVTVIDTQAAAPINVNAADAPGAVPLFRRLGYTALVLPSFMSPNDIVVAKDIRDGQPGQRLVYVTSGSGQIAVYEVDAILDGGDTLQIVNRERDGDESEMTQTSSPRLFEGTTEAVLGGNRRTDRPSFGVYNSEPLPAVDPTGEGAQVVRHFGIFFRQDSPREALNESWVVTAGGAIVSRPVPRGRLDTATGDFVTPEVLFCQHGVEVGDRLVVRAAPPLGACPEFKEGRAFSWTITGVTRQRLTLDPASGQVFERREDPAAGTALPSLVESPIAVPAMNEACFGEALAYEVRVPRGVYTVTGSQSGYLHPWAPAADGTCERVDDKPDALAPIYYAGRLQEWTLTGTLGACPPTDSEADAAYSGEWFQNPTFILRVLPGCTQDDAGALVAKVTEDGLSWHFSTNSAHSLRLIGGRSFGAEQEPTMTNPRSARWVPAEGKLYVTDGGQEKIVEIEVGSDLILRTFF